MNKRKLSSKQAGDPIRAWATLSYSKAAYINVMISERLFALVFS